jgi:hypothetical protein
MQAAASFSLSSTKAATMSPLPKLSAQGIGNLLIGEPLSDYAAPLSSYLRSGEIRTAFETNYRYVYIPNAWKAPIMRDAVFAALDKDDRVAGIFVFTRQDVGGLLAPLHGAFGEPTIYGHTAPGTAQNKFAWHTEVGLSVFLTRYPGFNKIQMYRYRQDLPSPSLSLRY